MKLSLVLPICLSFVIISQAAPMNFDKRRFGVEHTPEADATFQEVKDLAQGSDKEAQAGNLSGAMVRALLAKAPACDQQDRADEVIDLGKEFGGKKLEQYIDVAKRYRQLERNTPGEGQPSELCDKKPKNKELEGLTQAQDPTGKGKEADPVEDPEKEEDPKKVEDPKEDPEKEDPEKEDPEKEDPEKEDPEKEDPEKEDPEKEDPEKEDPEKEDPEKEDPEKEDPEKEDPEKEDPEKEDPEKEDPEKEDPEKEDPEKEDPEKEDPEKEDPEKEDPEKEDPEKETGENVAETDPVGGVKMPKIQKVNGDFIVNGNGFNGNLDAAHSRQCDVQKNQCFNKFNGGDKSFSGQDCEDQVTKCKDGPPVFA